MAATTVSWSDEGKCLVFHGGLAIVELSRGSFDCDISECSEVLAEDLKVALGRAADRQGFAPAELGVWWPRADEPHNLRKRLPKERSSELELFSLNERDEFEHIVTVNRPVVENREGIAAIIGGLIDAHGVELKKVNYYGMGEERSVECVLTVKPDWRISQLVELGRFLRNLLDDSHLSPLTPFGAYSLIVTGNGGALVGQPESDWLEVKQKGYAFTNDMQKHEYALDLAAMANTETGGLLAIGLKTMKDSAGRDLISKVCGCKPGSLHVQSYSQIAKQRITPDIEGITFRVVEEGAEHVLAIYIPPQPDFLQPFIVRGGVSENGRLSTASFTIPRRVGDGRWHMSAEAVHSLLVAARAALKRK